VLALQDFEFTKNIDEILSIPEIDAINFNPIDYSLGIGAKIDYNTNYKRL